MQSNDLSEIDYDEEEPEEENDAAIMIDIWKKLQDLLRIQTQEEI